MGGGGFQMTVVSIAACLWRTVVSIAACLWFFFISWGKKDGNVVTRAVAGQRWLMKRRASCRQTKVTYEFHQFFTDQQRVAVVIHSVLYPCRAHSNTCKT